MKYRWHQFNLSKIGLVVAISFLSQTAIAKSKVVVDDVFDNGKIQNAGNGLSSYWLPFTNVVEADGKAKLIAQGRPYSKTTLSTPVEKQVSLFHRSVTVQIDHIAFKQIGNVALKEMQLRLGFRERNKWSFRNTKDAIAVQYRADGIVTVCWKVAQNQLDPESGQRVFIKKLDMTLGAVTGLVFTVDGTGDDINWILHVKQKKSVSKFWGVIGTVDTKAIKDGWGSNNHRAVVSVEVQGKLGKQFEGRSVSLEIDRLQITSGQ